MTTRPLSPGLAQAGLALLELLQRQPLTAPQLLSGLREVGGMPPSEALALAQTLNWLAVDEKGVLNATVAGLRIASSASYDFALRRIVLDYVELVKPNWLQNAPYGRARVLAFCPPGVGQIMVEAGAAGEPSDDVVAFWDDLASIARGLHDDRMLAIGRQGERLTIAHEKSRTKVAPRWVAIDSNQDGYDVLSIKAADDPAFLPIEVKASRVGLAGSLHLSRQEWDKALESPTYVFHLWDLSATTAPRLAVVPLILMAEHVPADAGAGCWETVRAPFSEFENLFGNSLAYN